MHQIGNRIDNGNETLKISKEYSEKADKLSDSFITMLEVIYGVAGLLLGALVGIFYSFLNPIFKIRLPKKSTSMKMKWREWPKQRRKQFSSKKTVEY
ncbi:MAG: hypothetical protein IPG87_07955 [Saprospiraceae bacterium]|nr:hypothetical protein [Candidatus Vicinibacter affinis]